MSEFWSQLISGISGIITGVIGTICYNKLHSMYQRRKHEIEKEKLKSVNIFEEYGRERADCIVSFDNQHAIQTYPLFQNGIYLLRAEINVENIMSLGTQRDFVMVLLKYFPASDWSCYVECGYKLQFKIRGNIQGIQIEIKDSSNNRNKLIDEYVPVTDSFVMRTYPLSGDIAVWKSVGEVCFTVFLEEKYIREQKGYFEIMDFILEN